MYVRHILSRIQATLADGGLHTLLKRGSRYIIKIACFPYAVIKIKKITRAEDLGGLVEFTFRFCCGIIKPLQVRSEVLGLIKALQAVKPKIILEIGTANGGTLFLFSRIASRDATILSIDLPGGRFGGGYPAWKKKLYKAFSTCDQMIHLIRGDSHSHDTLDEVVSVLRGEKIDLLYIDGDHSYDGSKKDFEMYSSLVKKGGLVVLHDIMPHHSSDRRISDFWNDIKQKYRYEEIVEDRKQGWAGIGILYL